VRSLGDREVSARAIGELVMEELRHLDEVAYVRFASVYRHFEDVEAFHEEIERLRNARSQAPAQAHGAHAARHKRPTPRANRDQLPLLPSDPAANDAGPETDGKK
jgi:ATP cone domain